MWPPSKLTFLERGFAVSLCIIGGNFWIFCRLHIYTRKWWQMSEPLGVFTCTFVNWLCLVSWCVGHKRVKPYIPF